MFNFRLGMETQWFWLWDFFVENRMPWQTLRSVFSLLWHITWHCNLSHVFFYTSIFTIVLFIHFFLTFVDTHYFIFVFVQDCMYCFLFILVSYRITVFAVVALIFNWSLATISRYQFILSCWHVGGVTFFCSTFLFSFVFEFVFRIEGVK